VTRHGDFSLTPSWFGRARVPRVVWHTIGLIVALLLAYAIWRGYQSPDFLLDLGALRLC
jgi:hypothetical protein